MNESHKTPITSFEQKQAKEKIESDHVSALRAEKLGKRLVRKTVKLIDSGSSEKKFFSPTLSGNKVDPESTTLALNSELKSKEVDVEAAVTVEWDGSVGDPGWYNLLRLTKVEGETVIPPKNSLHRGK